MSTLGLGTSDDELLTQSRSEALFRDDPDSALAGGGLLSSEAHGTPLSMAAITLATESPDRFLSLVSTLTPIIQDILIQYYLLGRTYDQIRSLLFPRNTSNECVKIGNRIGVRALAVAASGISIAALPPDSPLRSAWSDMLRWNPDHGGRRPVTIRAPRDLGSFIIHPNGQLRELFAPRWSVLPGAGGKGI